MKYKLNDNISNSNPPNSQTKQVNSNFLQKQTETIQLSDGQTLCGDFEIQIDREGLWFYHGSPIGRKELIKLLASVLSMDENGRYWLTTPAEKGEILVEAVPFHAVEMNVCEKNKQQILSFRTNIDETIIADIDHPIRIDNNPETGEPSPYITVRDRLEARLTRAVFYQMVDLGVEVIMETEQELGAINEKVFGVWSSGQFFQIGKLT